MFTSLPYISFQVNELWKAHMRHQYPAETLDKDIISLCAPSCLLQKVHLAFSHAQSYYPWTVSCDLFRINKKNCILYSSFGEELRKWFLSMETVFFRYLIRLESPESHVWRKNCHTKHCHTQNLRYAQWKLTRIDEGLHIAALLRFCSIKVKR
jgi:hypothetical protein